ncbi:hypothetical protein M885DRAFT_575474 [Pelagophyceae sp. CCMP2097]|nr:hypothetical protein M885DRAFT_575474 [Pelagophyceae sp. CCMP2097]
MRGLAAQLGLAGWADHSIAALQDDADHAHYPWENAPSITVDGIVPGALAYYAAALSDAAAAMDVERAPNSERSCSLEAALENGDLQSLTLDVLAALYDGVRLQVGGVQEVHIFEVDLRRFTEVVDMTTQEEASLLCGDNADEVYSRCEVRVWPEQCAAAKTERRWQLRGMSSSRYLNTLRDVKGADRSPPAAISSLGLAVHRLDLLVPTSPDGVAADPALGLNVLRLYLHVSTLPDVASWRILALGLDVHRLDPLVPIAPPVRWALQFKCLA